MKQLIFDIETLGNDSNAVLLMASFLVYDLKADTPYQLNELRSRVKTFKLSVEEQKKSGRVITPETMQWWKEQIAYEPSLKSVLAPSENDLTMKEFYDQLCEYLEKEGYNKKKDWAWQRGSLDIMVLNSIFYQLKTPSNAYPIEWRNIRDLRTAIDLTAFPEKMNGYTNDAYEKAPRVIKGFAKHDPASDILMEVMMLRDCQIFEDDEIPF